MAAGSSDDDRSGDGAAPRSAQPGGRSRRPRRARLDPEARRAQLVAVALRLLEERGTSTMSVEDVADAAGVSRSLVYAYFGDRDGLVAEVYLQVLDQLDRALLPHLQRDMQRDEGTMTAVVVGCMRFAREQPAAWRLLVTDSVRGHPDVVRARARRVEELAGAPTDRSADTLVADALLGMVESGVLHWLDRSDLAPEPAALLLTRVVWNGLADLARD